MPQPRSATLFPLISPLRNANHTMSATTSGGVKYCSKKILGLGCGGILLTNSSTSLLLILLLVIDYSPYFP